MQLLKFIKENPKDWKTKIQEAPYHITVKEDDPYTMLCYNLIKSDFNYQLTRECRGIILKGSEIVCRGFDKFGNYGESYVPEIDWETARVKEKLDGSLIKVWFDDGWIISTNGTIDAYRESPYIDNGYSSFGDLFNSVIGFSFITTKYNPYSDMDKSYTHLFELCTPYNRVVVLHEDSKVYYLGSRNNKTGNYADFTEIKLPRPKQYNIPTLDECKLSLQNRSFEFEGYVVVDGFDNMMKLKNRKYINAAYVGNNGAITTRRAVKIMREDGVDELLSYYPEKRVLFDKIENTLDSIGDSLKSFLMEDVSDMDRKDIAVFYNKSKCPGYLFYKLDDGTMDFRSFIDSRLSSFVIRLLKRNGV